MKSTFFILFSALVLSSCIKIDLFEKNISIPKHDWYWSNVPEINFDIGDTTASYKVYFTMRHTASYGYRNIWLLLHSRQPMDSTFKTQRIELQLQDATGKWMEASGMDDIWNHRIYLTTVRFSRKGIYTIRIEQNMRDNPLKHVMDAGIRIEKINE